MLRKNLFVIFSVFFLVFSCSKEVSLDNISLPQTSILKINNSWAVVQSTHLRLRENQSTNSKAILTLWRNSILEIIDKTDNKEVVDENEDYWYKVKYDGIQGWVFGEYIHIYKSRNAAESSIRK